MESVFVEVPKDLKGYVIGKGGYKKNEIMQQSGAIIRSLSREEEGFTVIGNAEQIERATMLMLETVVSLKPSIGGIYCDTLINSSFITLGRFCKITFP